MVGDVRAAVRSVMISVAVLAALLIATAGPARAAVGPFVYVASTSSNAVLVIDPATNAIADTISVAGPRNVAVSSDGTRVYVTADTSPPGTVSPGTVAVIDAAINTVVAAVPVGDGPYGVAVSKDGTRVYVANRFDNTVSVIATATNSVVATIPVGASPNSLALSATAKRLYVPTSGVGHSVVVIDTTTNTVVASLNGSPLGLSRADPHDVAITPDGAKAYVTVGTGQPAFFSGAVVVIDTATNTVIKSMGSFFPGTVAFGRNGTRAYVTKSDGRVEVYDVTTDTLIATIEVPTSGGPIAASTDGARVYVSTGNTVSVIDTATNTVVGVAPVPAYIGGIAVGPSPTGAGSPGSSANLLEADTATIEGSVGQWVPWFSSAVSGSTTSAHGGTHSLKVDVTAPYGWGVQLRNFPGFAASAGTHVFAFWGRSATPGLAATMTVTWRSASRVILGTDTVTLSLGADWSETDALAVAPTGTAFANVDFSNPSGVAGDTIFLDDIAVTPVTDALDAPTSTLETSVGKWVPWFSSAVSQTTAQAHGSTHSLEVDVTAPYGWGVQLSNFPGFPTTGGAHVIGFWGKSTTPGLAATMTVTWRDVARTPMQTDTVTLPLGTAWSKAAAVVFPPPSAAFANVTFSNPSGNPGDKIFLDDVAVLSVHNALDDQTASLERSQGQWVPWFSSTVSSSTAAARSGYYSLQVDVTAPYGWGVQLQNWPGFATIAGSKSIGFWGRSSSPGLAATMTVTWRDASGSPLGTEHLTLALTDTWAQAVADVTAPAGTALVTVELTNPAGVPGDTIFLDDIFVVDATIPAPSP